MATKAEKFFEEIRTALGAINRAHTISPDPTRLRPFLARKWEREEGKNLLQTTIKMLQELTEDVEFLLKSLDTEDSTGVEMTHEATSEDQARIDEAVGLLMELNQMIGSQESGSQFDQKLARTRDRYLKARARVEPFLDIVYQRSNRN